MNKKRVGLLSLLLFLLHASHLVCLDNVETLSLIGFIPGTVFSLTGCITTYHGICDCMPKKTHSTDTINESNSEEESPLFPKKKDNKWKLPIIGTCLTCTGLVFLVVSSVVVAVHEHAI